MSFSPLEIAKVNHSSIESKDAAKSTVKAFQSPILDQCNSNSSGREIAKGIGETRLQYGAKYSMDKDIALAFARPELVNRPVKEVRFDV